VSSKSRWRRKICWAVCAVLMLALGAYNYVRVYCCAPIHLTLSGGNVCPLRSEMAKQICREVGNSGIILAASPGTNSEAICRAVDAGKLNLGLVLGGFPPDAHPHVRQVATLGVEPLHLLVRGELLTGAAPTLAVLRGRRVALGERGTNGAILAADLLRFAGMRPTTADAAGDFDPDYSREAEMMAQLRSWKRAAPPVRATLAERLPDAVFIVDSLPSPLVDELVTTVGYNLVPLPYATALHLDNRRDHSHVGHRLESSRIEPLAIPAFAYGIRPAVPAQDCPTFGLRLLLVAHEDVPTTAVSRLLRALDSGAAQRYHIDLEAGNVNHEFPLHPGAVAFAKDRRPLTIGQMLEPLTNMLSVLGAGAAGGLALWGFLRGLRAVNPDVHLRQIDRIERLLQGSEQDEAAPSLPLEFIGYLESQLAQVKQMAIEDYAKGRLDSDEALVGILTLVADTRHMLVQRRKLICAAESALPARTTRLAEAA
jgi:TRAP-type uncharacterized transport system substrate-binding protein